MVFTAPNRETSPVQLLYNPGGKERAAYRGVLTDATQGLLANPQDATRSIAWPI